MAGGSEAATILSQEDNHASVSAMRPNDDYTEEERKVLASIRKSSGRTCVNCEWHNQRGNHHGCYPEGRYRKFLSASEFEAGCDSFRPKSS